LGGECGDRAKGSLGEINAKSQGRKDALVVDLPQRSRLFGRNKRKGTRAQRRKGSGSPAEIPAVSVVDLSGCLIEGTIVTVSSRPGQSTSTDSLWSNPSWLDEPSQETPWLAPERYASVATRTELQVPIDSVPIGARVPTRNPNRSEVDPQPEPDQASWAKLSITAEGSDGGIVDAEIIRPCSWILRNGVCAGRMLPFNLPELEVSGLALVTAIDDCQLIACGEGSVVTDLGTLFASIPPSAVPGAWHRFGPPVC